MGMHLTSTPGPQTVEAAATLAALPRCSSRRAAAAAAYRSWAPIIDRGTEGLLSECRNALQEGAGREVLDALLVDLSKKHRTEQVLQMIDEMHTNHQNLLSSVLLREIYQQGIQDFTASPLLQGISALTPCGPTNQMCASCSCCCCYSTRCFGPTQFLSFFS